jgi:hypothetical protein
MEKTHQFFNSFVGRTATSITLAFALAAGFHAIGERAINPENQKEDMATAELYTQGANKIQKTLVVESAVKEIETLSHSGRSFDCTPISIAQTNSQSTAMRLV